MHFGIDSGIFAGHMTFLIPNRECEKTEGFARESVASEDL